jgi:hypothetical protein
MTEETQTPDATQPPQTPPEAASVPVLGRDGTPFDPQRAMVTINTLREVEKTGKARDLAQAAAIRALVSGMPLTAAAQAAIDAATPAAATETDHYKQAFSDLSSALLGVEYDGDPDRLVAAAKSARLEGALTSAIVESGADLALTRLALAPKLSAINPSSPTLAADLKELVGHAILDHGALRRQTSAVVSGAPFPAGSGGGQAPNYISAEAISMASAGQIVEWRKAGLIPGYGGDRR